MTFSYLPDYATLLAGIQPIFSGFFTEFSPLMFWGALVFWGVVIAIIIYKIVANAINGLTQNIHSGSAPVYNMSTGWGSAPKTNHVNIRNLDELDYSRERKKVWIKNK